MKNRVKSQNPHVGRHLKLLFGVHNNISLNRYHWYNIGQWEILFERCPIVSLIGSQTVWYLVVAMSEFFFFECRNNFLGSYSLSNLCHLLHIYGLHVGGNLKLSYISTKKIKDLSSNVGIIFYTQSYKCLSYTTYVWTPHWAPFINLWFHLKLHIIKIFLIYFVEYWK